MKIRLDEEAAQSLRVLPPPLRTHVYRELQRLASNPAALSRPAAFPHPLDGQLFDTKILLDNTQHFFTVMFRYAADEEHIDIAWLVHRQRPGPGFPN
jgi:hypothetical protein